MNTETEDRSEEIRPDADADVSATEEFAAESDLERARREAAEFRDQLLRLAAEFENYKRRIAREREEWSRSGLERSVLAMLPVVDDLERSVKALPAGGRTPFEAGIEMIYQKMRGILTALGVAPMETIGAEFDVALHEAVLSMPSDKPEHTVIDEIQRGYLSGERVLRLAKVIVAAAPAEHGGAA